MASGTVLGMLPLLSGLPALVPRTLPAPGRPCAQLSSLTMPMEVYSAAKAVMPMATSSPNSFHLQGGVRGEWKGGVSSRQRWEGRGETVRADFVVKLIKECYLSIGGILTSSAFLPRSGIR